MSDDPTRDLLFEIRDGVGYLTFNRPEQRNAFTFEMYERLAELCQLSPETKGAKVLVLTGAGDQAFASGTDISQFLNFNTEADVLGYETRMSAVLDAVEDCPIPTIAAIRGACTGGGAAIAAACDLRIGAPSQRFGVPIARTLGNCLSPDNLARFSVIIGPSRFKEIIFTARLVGAEEAYRIGWLHELVESEEQLMARAEELAARIAGYAPITLRVTKTALKRLRDAADPGEGSDLMLAAYLSEDFREGVRAFLDKRPANWQGR
jgi:enoyl-CoA hydratase/carnithine racemase